MVKTNKQKNNKQVTLHGGMLHGENPRAKLTSMEAMKGKNLAEGKKYI